MSLLRMPLTAAQYFPDPSEPVDHWFQADNASNPRTTLDLILEVSQDRPTLVIDPFCGSGSTASAARLLGLPFYGIEADPLLVCTSIAKSWASVQYTALLRAFPDVHTATGLTTAYRQIWRSCGRRDALVASAMAGLMAFRNAQGRRLETAEMATDLTLWPEPITTGQIIRGDALHPNSWKQLGLPSARAVMYTSPPFGLTSPVIHPPPYVKAAANAALADFDANTWKGGIPEFPGYAQMTIGMLHQAIQYLTCGALIVEHEPDDLGVDSTEAVVAAVASEFRGVIHSPRIVPCGEFSRRGMMSLIIFNVR